MDQTFPIVRLQKEPKRGKRIPGRKPRFPAKIPYQRQVERLGEKFESISSTLGDLARGIDVSTDPRTVVPERALVFELIGPVKDFDVAIQAIGFEWLTSEHLSDVSEDEDEPTVESEGQSPKLLYLTMPSLEGLNKLLALWRQFKKGSPYQDGQKPLWDMFGYLADLRGWSAKDRVDPSIAKYVEALLSAAPDRQVLIEFNFWYRPDESRRDQALRTLDEMLEEVGGTRLDFVDINEIGYQGALVQVPASVAKRLSEGEGKLARLDDVMTIRPQSAYESLIEPTEAPALPDISGMQSFTGPCIAALLDGYPVANHTALSNRLYVHEVDVTATQVPVDSRYHGTAMASLVLHGDLHSAEPAIARKLAVIPVLTSNPKSGQETTPVGKLPIGVIYRSLKAIVDADKTKHPELANVTLINHSLGDTFAPFVRRASPWAALLDYFSHRYQLLFVVSAGNIFAPFQVEEYANLAEFEAADPLERQAAILNAIERSKGHRSILSPAESVNSLTIGAIHSDGAESDFLSAVDPYPHMPMTNLASSVGFGVNRGLKPDLIHPGGRFAAGAANIASGGINVYPKPTVHAGHLVASPSVTGNLQHAARMAGTSNAAALVTRVGLQIADVLDSALASEALPWYRRVTRAPMLKALITHSCNWGKIGTILEESYPPTTSHGWAARRDTISKFLGYGAPQPERVFSGADHRITLLADDELLHGQLHEYRVPLPAAMLRNRELRSITLTLAWTTPIVTTTADYRGVALKLVDIKGKKNFWDGVGRSTVLQPNGHTADRGTLIHLKLSGKVLRDTSLSEGIFVGVQAMARHSSMEREAIPYALAITMEVAQSLKTSGLYNQVLQAINVRTKQRAARVGVRG